MRDRKKAISVRKVPSCRSCRETGMQQEQTSKKQMEKGGKTRAQRGMEVQRSRGGGLTDILCRFQGHIDPSHCAAPPLQLAPGGGRQTDRIEKGESFTAPSG